MSETATPATADALTPANILQPASVPVPTELNNPAETKAETAPAKPDAATDAKPPDNQDTSQEDANKDDPKRKASHRINELYAQKKAAERDARQHAQEAADLRRQLAELQRVPPDDIEGRQRADIRSAVKEERLQQVEQDAIRQAEIAHSYRLATFDAKIEAARERIPDLDQAIAEFIKLPGDVIDNVAADIISESDKAAEIAWYLGKHPDEAQRLANLPPHRKAAEIVRIEGKVERLSPRRTSSAPPPVPMVTASSAPSQPTLQQMGVEDIGKLIYGR